MLAAIVMVVSYKIIKSKQYFSRPTEDENSHPKTWLRTLLIGTSAWVSFAHGSNDGQKWVGLAMLILVALVPSVFAINPNVTHNAIQENLSYIESTVQSLASQEKISDENIEVLKQTQTHISHINTLLDEIQPRPLKIRLAILELQNDFKKINTPSFTMVQTANADGNTSFDSKAFNEHADTISWAIDYAPKWIIFLISLSLGLGTMIGWKRIVVTIGEKIGKEKLSYAQATTAALITAITISTASRLGLPVSTTHVLSSSVAGSMTSGKHAGIQGDTVKTILMAWILTLPVTILLSGGIFSILWFVIV
jgi:phosphate/sulfate permease